MHAPRHTSARIKDLHEQQHAQAHPTSPTRARWASGHLVLPGRAPAPYVQEVHDALASIEGEAERLLAPERGLMDADARERDRLYARSEAVSAALMTLGEDLHATVRRAGGRVGPLPAKDVRCTQSKNMSL